MTMPPTTTEMPCLSSHADRLTTTPVQRYVIAACGAARTPSATLSVANPGRAPFSTAEQCETPTRG